MSSATRPRARQCASSFHKRVVALFLDLGSIDRDHAEGLLCLRRSGFIFEGDVELHAANPAAMQHLGQYMARPPIALSKVALEEQGVRDFRQGLKLFFGPPGRHHPLTWADIDKFVGDEIMAILKGPVKELSACRASIEIRAALAAEKGLAQLARLEGANKNYGTKTRINEAVNGKVVVAYLHWEVNLLIVKGNRQSPSASSI